MNTVNVPWVNPRGRDPDWNIIACVILEHFGLPGDKYVTGLNGECMMYHFKSEKDALMCKLLVSESL